MGSSVAALAAVLFASWASAAPHPLIKRDTTLTSAAVTWYQAPLNFQGSASLDGSCGFNVSQGDLNVEQCYTMHTDALGIQQTPEHECVFKLWDDVSDCSGDGTWTGFVVPAGDSWTCIETGVLDGGNFMHKSGSLTCS